MWSFCVNNPWSVSTRIQWSPARGAYLMDLLTSDKSIGRRGLSSTTSIQLVPSQPITLRKSNKAKVAICLSVLASFAGGFAASHFLRRSPAVEEVKAQIADFHIVLPEGQ